MVRLFHLLIGLRKKIGWTSRDSVSILIFLRDQEISAAFCFQLMESFNFISKKLLKAVY